MRAIILAFLFALAGCDGDHGHDHDHEDHADHDHAADAHVHHAKRGGHLLELGDHLATIEIVHDREAGKLIAYIMDGHADRPVRLGARSIPVTLTVAGEDLMLDLKPVADRLTGETVGDTSQFEATADALRNITKFKGSIGKVSIYRQEFKAITFTYEPESAD